MAESESPGGRSDDRAWLKLLLGILAAAAFLLLLGAGLRYEETATFRCPKCLSTMESEYRGFKAPLVRPVGGTPHRVVISTALSAEVFGGRCAHFWPLVTYSQTGRSPDLPPAAAPFEGNPLSVAYETMPRFRALVREKLSSGSLALERARDLFSLLPNPDTKQQADPAQRLLMDEANSLLDAAGLPAHPPWAPALKK